MTTVTLNYPAAVNPPLACDCRGAPVFIKFKAGFANITRDGHGAARALLESRTQASNGSWIYVFSIFEPDLVTPTPSVGGSYIESVCCQACLGFAGEAFRLDEFVGRLVAEDEELAEGTIPVRRFIRPWQIRDLRAWIDREATADVVLRLLINGVHPTGAVLTIPAGELVDDHSWVLPDGYLIAENAQLSLEVAENGAVDDGYGGETGAALGLEFAAFGYLNPSPYLRTMAARGAQYQWPVSGPSGDASGEYTASVENGVMTMNFSGQLFSWPVAGSTPSASGDFEATVVDGVMTGTVGGVPYTWPVASV